MVASLVLFTFIVTLDNIIDYGANFTFVRHVLSMDTTFPMIHCVGARSLHRSSGTFSTR